MKMNSSIKWSVSIVYFLGEDNVYSILKTYFYTTSFYRILQRYLYIFYQCMLVYSIHWPLIRWNYCIVGLINWFIPSQKSIAVWFVVFWSGSVIVQSLCHQVQGQTVFCATGFLDFGPFVLEPDFDLRFIKAEFLRQALPPLLGEIPVCLKLGF